MRRPTEMPAHSSEPVPDVVARFAVTPLLPSVFDTVRLFDYSYDPGRVGIASRLWRFGDGTATDAPAPSHQYVEDGEFTIALTVTTGDGRAAGAEQLVRVSTHDVAVTDVVAPLVGAVGQTCPVTVSVASRRTETVQVELLRTTRKGVREPIELLTRAVEQSTTAEFSFAYTFTPDDAVAGSLTFEALATIIGARDALPADNIRSAVATIVH